MMKRTALATILCLLAGAVGGVKAEDKKQPEPAATTAAPAAAPASPSGLSQSKFLGLLYSEIARRTPKKSEAGPGSATASFHVAASGQIDKVTISSATSPAHGNIVRKILIGLQGPPPPGGSFELSQTFKFH